MNQEIAGWRSWSNSLPLPYVAQISSISMTNEHPLADTDEKEALPRRSSLSRRLAAVGLTVVLGLSLLAVFPPRPFRDLHSACIDLLALAMPTTNSLPGIVIVEIDDDSLAKHGQWPWPRTLMAQLIDAIDIHDPAVITTNILFPERDRSSPQTFLPPPTLAETTPQADKQSTAMVDHDLVFAGHLASAPLILGYEFLFDEPINRDHQACSPPAVATMPVPHASAMVTVHQAKGLLCNYPPLQQVATGAGFLNGGADEDGVLRRLPLLMGFEQKIYPSLALATVLHLLGPSRPSIIDYRLGGLVVQVGSTRILTDNRGQFRLAQLQPDSLTRLSAHKLLSGNINGAAIKDKIVLLGCHAPGLSQSYPTPFASTTPLLDLHAAAIATLLSPRQLHQPPSFSLVESCTALLFTLVLLAVACRFPIFLTVPLALTLVATIWLGAGILCRQSGLLLSPLLPSLALLINTPLLITMTLRDQQRQAQLRLQASEQQLRSIIHTVPDIIFRLDPQGKITFVSPAVTRYGLTPEELIGRSIFDSVHPADRAKATYRINERRTGTRATLDFELRLILSEPEDRNPSEARIFSISAEGLYQNDQASGVFLGTQGIARDIAEKKRLQQKLIQAQKMEAIGNLAAGIAHDLNNILTGLISYPDLILLEIPPENPLHAKIVSIRNSGKKAAAIVQDLLSLARRRDPATEMVDINGVINEYLSSPEYHELRRHHDGVLISSHLSDKPALVKGSALQLAKVVMNLVHNAIEASAAGDRIVIATDTITLNAPRDAYERIAAGSYVRITVADGGSGIATADLPRIFEPFFSRKKVGRSGTGLGMSIVWSSVKDHRGFVDLTSQEGHGTTFQVYLPEAIDRSPSS